MKEICVDCKEEKEIFTLNRCFVCYIIYYQRQKNKKKTYIIPKEQCSICGFIKTVAMRTDDGKAVCHACYQRKFHLEQCSICGFIKTVAMRTDDGKAVCHACYQRKFHLEQCSICGFIKGIHTRTDDGKAVCNACYEQERRAKIKALSQ